MHGVAEPVELFVVDVIAVSTPATAFPVRCDAGTLRIGDELTAAIDPEGASHPLNARCTSTRLSPAMPVTELDVNFGGEIILEGARLNPIQEGWILRAEA